MSVLKAAMTLFSGAFCISLAVTSAFFARFVHVPLRQHFLEHEEAHAQHLREAHIAYVFLCYVAVLYFANLIILAYLDPEKALKDVGKVRKALLFVVGRTVESTAIAGVVLIVVYAWEWWHALEREEGAGELAKHCMALFIVLVILLPVLVAYLMVNTLITVIYWLIVYHDLRSSKEWPKDTANLPRPEPVEENRTFEL